MLQRVQDDIRRSAKRDRFQKERGSDTFANFSAAEALGSALTGQYSDSMIGNTISRRTANYIASWIAKIGMDDPEEAVRQILTQAMLDPGVANSLLKQATPERVDGLLRHIFRTSPMRDVRRAAGMTAARSNQKTEEKR